MTLNEVEQAIRNLITNQPMVTSGSSGEVVNSILSIINSYRNFSFLIQNHPAQDTFKFNAMNISQRMESDISNLICQTLQERGINLMMYMPATQFNAGQNPYMYQNMNTGVTANLAPNMNAGVLGGQVVYNNPTPMPQQPVGQVQYPQPNGVQYNGQMQPPYPQFRPRGAQRPVMRTNTMRVGQPLYPKTAAPTQPISFGDLNQGTMPQQPMQQPVSARKREFTMQKPASMQKPAGQLPKVPVAHAPKPVNVPKQVQKRKLENVQKAESKQKIEPKVEEPVVVKQEEPAEQEPNLVKATGRNYLLELLKK